MKALVTGASGFIGSHLVKALEARGDEVTKLPRELIYNNAINLDGFLKINKPDYIFSLAAYGNMSDQKNTIETFRVNLAGTLNLLMGSKDIPYKAFINVSTSSVLLPHETMYSATKAGAERLCKAFADEYGKPIITVRPYSVYGSGEADFRFIPTVFRSCVQGDPITIAPEPRHDWIYVDDVVQDLLTFAEFAADGSKGEIWDSGTGHTASNSEVIELIEGITCKKANYTIAEKPLRNFDSNDWPAANIDPTTRLHRVLLGQGLRKYYAWYMGLI